MKHLNLASLFCVSVIFLISSEVSYGDIFKWKDSRGKVHYSDKKPIDNSNAPTQKLIKAVLDTNAACTVKKPSENITASKQFEMNFFSSFKRKFANKPSATSLTKNTSPTQWNKPISKPSLPSASSASSLLNSASGMISKNAKPAANGNTASETSTSNNKVAGNNNSSPANNTPAASSPAATTNANASSTTNYLPTVNVSLTPFGSPGHSAIRVMQTNERASQGSDSSGAFRIVCEYSHMSNNDPIIFPNMANAAHHHTFFGNTGVDHQTTSKSLETTGNSTCHGGIMNRSAYWIPSVINTANGAPIKPTNSLMYYKTHDAAKVTPPPQGLKIIAGNAKSTSEQLWITRYTCNGDYNTRKNHIPACSIGSTMELMMIFPDCWDGKNLDSPDHKSHMAYSNSSSCPATHPVLIPQITFNVNYKVESDTTKWRLASDNYPTTKPGGYSLHGDWMNGWDPQFSAEFVNNCLKARKDCHAHLLGDRRQMY